MEYIYAALLLHKLGKEINEESMTKVLQASGAEVEDSKVKNLVASLKDVDIESELANAVVASAAAPASKDASEEKSEESAPEEKKEESTAGLSSLFG